MPLRVGMLTKTREGLEICVGHGLVVVEGQENNGLEGADYNLLVTLGEYCLQLAVRQRMFPLQLTSRVLHLVMLLEVCCGVEDDLRNIDLDLWIRWPG